MFNVRGQERWSIGIGAWKRNDFFLVGNLLNCILEYEKYQRKPVASKVTDVW